MNGIPGKLPRRLRVAVALSAVTAAAVFGCRPRDQAPPAAAAEDPEYLAAYADALAVANAFCRAWQAKDVGAGKALLSTRVRRTFPDQQMHDAIAGPANPAHLAFEIHDGSREDERFAFRLRLFYRFAGRAQQRVEARDEAILLVREGEAWLVDAFPLLERPRR